MVEFVGAGSKIGLSGWIGVEGRDGSDGSDGSDGVRRPLRSMAG